MTHRALAVLACHAGQLNGTDQDYDHPNPVNDEKSQDDE